MRAIIPLKTDGDVRKSDRSSRCAICSWHGRNGWAAVRIWWLISFASSGCQSLATSVRAVATELKSLEIPDALAILKERNHSVLADSEDASEARGGDSGRSTTAFNVLGVQVCQVRVTENRAEC